MRLSFWDGQLELAQTKLVDQTKIAELQLLGVEYVYIGAKGNFAEPGLDAAQSSTNKAIVYQRDDVTTLKVDGYWENRLRSMKIRGARICL